MHAGCSAVVGVLQNYINTLEAFAVRIEGADADALNGVIGSVVNRHCPFIIEQLGGGSMDDRDQIAVVLDASMLFVKASLTLCVHHVNELSSLIEQLFGFLSSMIGVVVTGTFEKDQTMLRICSDRIGALLDILGNPIWLMQADCQLCKAQTWRAILRAIAKYALSSNEMRLLLLDLVFADALLLLADGGLLMQESADWNTWLSIVRAALRLCKYAFKKKDLYCFEASVLLGVLRLKQGTLWSDEDRFNILSLSVKDFDAPVDSVVIDNPKMFAALPTSLGYRLWALKQPAVASRQVVADLPVSNGNTDGALPSKEEALMLHGCEFRHVHEILAVVSFPWKISNVRKTQQLISLAIRLVFCTTGSAPVDADNVGGDATSRAVGGALLRRLLDCNYPFVDPLNLTNFSLIERIIIAAHVRLRESNKKQIKPLCTQMMALMDSAQFAQLSINVRYWIFAAAVNLCCESQQMHPSFGVQFLAKLLDERDDWIRISVYLWSRGICACLANAKTGDVSRIIQSLQSLPIRQSRAFTSFLAAWRVIRQLAFASSYHVNLHSQLLQSLINHLMTALNSTSSSAMLETCILADAEVFLRHSVDEAILDNVGGSLTDRMVSFLQRQVTDDHFSSQKRDFKLSVPVCNFKDNQMQRQKRILSDLLILLDHGRNQELLDQLRSIVGSM